MVDKSKKKSTKKSAKIARKTPGDRRTAKAVKPHKSVADSPDTTSASSRIDEKIAKLGDWRGDKLAEIRELIHEADPQVVEEWKWMGSPVWSHDGIFVIGNAHKDKVKLTFSHGARLADPKKLFNAGLGGNQWRAIDLYDGDSVAKVAFKALVREAVSFNVEKKAAKKKPAVKSPKVAKKSKGA